MAFIMAHNANMMNAELFNTSNPKDSFNDDFESATITHGSRPPPIPTTSVSSINFQDPSMPVTTSPQSLFASFPSLMSVFGEGTDVRRQRGGEALAISAPSRSVNVAKRPSPSSHFSSPIFRRDSASTFESAESSPTTTISTVDSSLTEPSPSSSPESPTSLLPLSSLKPLGIQTQSIRKKMETKDGVPNSLATLPRLNRADSPNKKMRNTKNLMVNTAASSRQVLSLPKLAISTGPVPDGHPFSAPATPSFIVPPKPARRQLSNLGLTLATPESMLNHHDNSNAVPPTPLDPHIRMLSYSHHSSSIPIFSPTVAPEGGMRLPPFGNSAVAGCIGKTRPLLHASHHSSLDNTNTSPITRQTLDHVQEENDYELPLSREAKSPAYPQGPICIYEPYVYLYLEPTETEASEFDVVLNVAREVKNPFSAATATALSQSDDTAMQVSSDSDNTFFAGRRTVSEPQTAISDKSFRAVFETQLQDLSRDNGNISTTSITPEYIHIPWDHNTNVVDDLLRLCELIDDRVQQRKRVLVHCQCGVSRSASLVVAYGLFKDPELTVQDAYNIVKGHSRWIGPNMNLIYQLSEFKSNLAGKTITSGPAWHTWRGTGSESKATAVGSFDTSITLPPTKFQGSPNEPSSAPYQTDREPPLPRANSLGTPTSSQMAEPSVGDVTPGPSSAPPDMLWSPNVHNEEPRPDSVALTEDQRSAPTPPKAMDIDTDGTPVPFTASFNPTFNGAKASASSPPPQLLPAGFSSLLSRRNGPPKLPLRQDSPRFTGFQLSPGSLDHAILDDVPHSPSLLSPRAAEFTASPFHRTAAGDLAGSSVFEQALMSPKPQDDDPRSPAQRGEAPITRNIFGLL